jgi:hypothetical protein
MVDLIRPSSNLVQRMTISILIDPRLCVICQPNFRFPCFVHRLSVLTNLKDTSILCTRLCSPHLLFGILCPRLCVLANLSELPYANVQGFASSPTLRKVNTFLLKKKIRTAITKKTLLKLKFKSVHLKYFERLRQSQFSART